MQKTLQGLLPAMKLQPDILISQLHRRLDDFVKQALRLDKSLQKSRVKRVQKRYEQQARSKGRVIIGSGSTIAALARAAKKNRRDEKQAKQLKRRRKSGTTKTGRKSRYVDFFQSHEFWNDADQVASSNENPKEVEDPKSVELETSSELSEVSNDDDDQAASSNENPKEVEDPKSGALEISSELSDASSISFHSLSQTDQWNGCSYWETNFPSQYTKHRSSKRMTGPESAVILKLHLKAHGIYLQNFLFH